MAELWDKFSDKFGIGDDNAPTGSVEMAVITATTPGLPPEEDSARVMRVVDAVNSTKYTGGVKKLQKALVKKLKSDHSEEVGLALHVCNVVIKECGPAVYEALGQREFLKNVEAPITGKLGFTVRDQALCLIQEWGITFANSPTSYYATFYQKALTMGCKFPLDETAAVASLAAEQSRLSSKTKARKSVMFVATEKELAKLDRDLDIVEYNINLCNGMLECFPSLVYVSEIQALNDVIAILEACVLRMTDLIDAGMKGSLTPELLERCLQINDKLTSTLETTRIANVVLSETTLKPDQKDEQNEEDEGTNMDDENESKEFPEETQRLCSSKD